MRVPQRVIRPDPAQRSLTPRQARALECFLTEPTLKLAAQKAQVPERTFYRWIKLPRFRRELDEARRRSFLQTASQLDRIAPLAVAALNRALRDPGTPPATRANAAVDLLRLQLDTHEQLDTNQSLAELERLVRPQFPEECR